MAKLKLTKDELGALRSLLNDPNAITMARADKLKALKEINVKVEKLSSPKALSYKKKIKILKGFISTEPISDREEFLAGVRDRINFSIRM